MTPAERQQLKRDRRKAGLVRVEVWVPADKVDDVQKAVEAATGMPYAVDYQKRLQKLFDKWSSEAINPDP